MQRVVTRKLQTTAALGTHMRSLDVRLTALLLAKGVIGRAVELNAAADAPVRTSLRQALGEPWPWLHRLKQSVDDTFHRELAGTGSARPCRGSELCAAALLWGGCLWALFKRFNRSNCILHVQCAGWLR